MMAIRRRTISGSEVANPEVNILTVFWRELFSGSDSASIGGIQEAPISNQSERRFRLRLESSSSYFHSLVFWILFIFTILLSTLDNWINYHFLSKTHYFFFVSWLKSIITVGILQIILKKFSLSFRTRFSNARKKFISLWPLVLLQSLTVYSEASDFLKKARNAAGSEFFQLAIVLSIPALIACLHAFSVMTTPGYVDITLFTCAGLQLMLLCRDPEFEFSFITSLYSLIFVAIKASYIVVLTGDLQQEAILQLIYYLNLGLCFSHPLALIIRGEIDVLLSELININELFSWIVKSFFMASSGIIRMTVIFFMLKITDPLVLNFALNASWIPTTLIHAFIFKLDFMVSSFRAFWIFLIILVTLLAREPWSPAEGRGETSSLESNIRIHNR